MEQGKSCVDAKNKYTVVSAGLGQILQARCLYHSASVCICQFEKHKSVIVKTLRPENTSSFKK